MRADAVGRHWMTSTQFLNAVARRGVVFTLLAAAATGLFVALAGGPLPG